jgi:hypothetical protein
MTSNIVWVQFRGMMRRSKTDYLKSGSDSLFKNKYAFENSLCYSCHVERSETSDVIRLNQMFHFVQHDKYHKPNNNGYLGGKRS